MFKLMFLSKGLITMAVSFPIKSLIKKNKYFEKHCTVKFCKLYAVVAHFEYYATFVFMCI